MYTLGGKSPAHSADTVNVELPFNLVANIRVLSVEQSKVMQSLSSVYTR